MLLCYGLLSTFLLVAVEQVDAGLTCSSSYYSDNSEHGSPRSIRRAPTRGSSPRGSSSRGSPTHERGSPSSHRSSPSRSRVFSIPVQMHGKPLYEAKVTIGNPPIEYMLDIGCEDHGHEPCLQGQQPYNPYSSESAEIKDEKYAAFYPQQKTYVNGVIVEDIFALGSGWHRVQLGGKFEFGAVDETNSQDHGNLGLSLPAKDITQQSILYQLASQGLMPCNMFTLYFKKCTYDQIPCDHAGLLTFGGPDERNCGPEIGDVDVGSKTFYWRFLIKSFEIKGRNRTPKKFTSRYAMTDTGTSEILLPNDLMQSLLRILREFREEEGIYYVKCDHVFTLTLNINGHEYEIPHENLYTERNLRTNRCRLLVKNSADTDIILGVPWFQTFCNVHYLWTDKRHRVAFSRPRY